jgi:SAM-dependent methyltransferase
MKWMYNMMYRWGIAPYDQRRPHPHLIEQVEAGLLAPGRTLVMACGPGNNAIYLAKQGFDVVAFDFAEAGIAVARQRAEEHGVDVDWRVDDATTMQTIEGVFDVVTDCGSLSDLRPEHRTAAYAALRRHLRPGTVYFHWGFEWQPRWYGAVIPRSFQLDEVQTRFSDDFEIEAIERKRGGPFVGFGCYRMTYRPEGGVQRG